MLENKNLMVAIMGAISSYLQLEQPVYSQPARTQTKSGTFWQTLKNIFSSGKGTS